MQARVAWILGIMMWMMKFGTTYSSITGRIGVKCIVDSKPAKQKTIILRELVLFPKKRKLSRAKHHRCLA